MGFQEYYSHKIDRLLYRSDIREHERQDEKYRGKLNWLENPDFASLLRNLDMWEKVPPEIKQRLSGGHLEKALNHASNAIQVIDKLSGPDDAINRKPEIQKHVDAARKAYEAICQYQGNALAYHLADQLREMERLPDLFSAVNDSLKNTKNAIDGYSKELGLKAGEALQTVDGIARGVRDIKENAEKDAERARIEFANHAITTFATAFSEESKDAEARAVRALAWIGGAAGLGMAAVVLLVIGEAQDWFASELSAWKWASLRIIGFGVLASIIGYFIRERRNFLHVAVANRHRRNLCNAYVSVADSMKEPERLEYLRQIIPHLAYLGKTGFIAKEDVPDMPIAQMADAAGRLLRSGKPGA